MGRHYSVPVTDIATAPRFRLTRMHPRDPHQGHRAATPLELFFDLVFVVAVSTASAQLHHELSAGHVENGLVSYGFMFFAIWWAWMNFTWFANSFSTDDWLYRILTFVQMGGVLVLAAGIPAAFHGDFTVPVIAYIVMRVAMIVQWLRASRSAGSARRATLFYAAGITIVQLCWVAFLFVPAEAKIAVFLLFVVFELAVPVIAERQGQTPWHPHHITERYSLFTLIVLGESLLASSNAIIEALDEVESLGPLISIAVLALVVTASLWWIYFWPPHHRAITTLASSIRYGYTHFFVFAAAAAFSAGIEVEIDRLTHHSKLDAVQASFTVTVPIAVFLLGIWWIAIRENADRVVNTAIPLAAVLVLLDPLLPTPVVFTAIVLVVVVVILVLRPPVGEEAPGSQP